MMPAAPGYYHKPTRVEDLVDIMAARMRVPADNDLRPMVLLAMGMVSVEHFVRASEPCIL